MTKDGSREIEKVWRQLAGRAGFSLIEGMIAAAILAVGILGLAGMQGIALSKNVDAHEMAQITNINADLMERIKFNRGRALAYHGIDTNNLATQPPGTQPMASGDYAQWRTMLTNSRLANARGVVTVVRLDPDPVLTPISLNRFAVSVVITWTTKDSAARPKSVTFASVLAPE
jgi:type IV pilus modification protein PilV